MAAQFYKINYKSDFVLTINSDAGWAVPFCIKFWTGMPSHGYFAGFDGENYVNCRVGETPTQLLVMFDDHHMQIGPLRMQIAYHTTIEEFPDRKFDEVTNPTNVTVDIDGTEYQVMLDFTGETGAEIDFSMPSSGVMSVNGKIGYVTLNAEDVGAQPTIEDLATIRSGAAEGATAVQPAEMTAALATKQDTITDLSTIRSGAAAGATAYQKPGTGIPASDLASGVQSSLQKADAAAPQSNTYTKGEVDTLIEGAISDIDVDDALSTTSENPVQNKVVTTALNGKQATISDLATIRSGAAAGATAVQPAALTPIENDIDAIEGKIPSAASASNQLADKAFVNSALADKADTSDIPTALSQLSQDSTHRVVTDAEKSTWNGKQNAIDDLATIRSGAAAGATAVQPAAMNTALAAKQDTLTFDNTPTANSNNPVKSSGIKTALDAKQSTISTVNVTVDNNTGTPSGSASVSGSTLSLSFQNLKGATGATGATGPQGPQGERGLPGESGVTGDVSGFTVIQTIDPSATYGATDIAGAATVQATNAELTELGGNLYEKKADNTISSSTYTFTASKYISLSNGNVVSGSSSWNCTEDYIPIDKWLSVYTTASGSSSAAAVAFYRADKTYISGAPCGTTATVQVPEDAAYARFSKAGGSHTITIYILSSKIDSMNDAIDAIESDLETNYQQKNKEIDYLPNVVQGIGYKSNGIGTTIVTNSNSAFYSAKIPCKKGDMFGIITKGFFNACPAIITDADNKVLWSNIVPNNITVGGVLEIAQDNAAYLYVSSYLSTITKLTKLVINSDDSIEVDSSYAEAGMLSITDSCGSYSGYVGFAIPLLLRKGDAVKIKFKSYLNYRGYILKNASGTIVGSLSDTDLSAETLFCWNGEEDVYLYVNGLSSSPPHIIRYSRNVAKSMKNYGKKMVALGDSITSYDSCDFGELVRGRLGVSFLKTSTQIDWGNIAEGNATICNWENTTNTCQHNSALVNGTYVNRTLPNQVLQLLQHVTAEGEQITWHISSNNSDHSLDTSVGVGTGYTTDIPDIIYIAMGTNDVVTTDDFSTVIAQSYSQLTKLTICSALRWSIETLQNKFPNAVIICVTPIVRTQRPTAEMEAKCELIKKMCAYMAIPVVDGYHISGFSPLSQGIYSSDNIHPNSYTQRIARSIAAQVDALC